MPTEGLRTLLAIFVSLLTVNFKTVLHIQSDQKRGPAKLNECIACLDIKESCEMPRTSESSSCKCSCISLLV